MKKMKKIMIASVALLACAFSFVGVANVNPAMADAEDAFYMDGASVRMKDPSGIRFHTIVNKKTEGYTYGTLLIPVADFTGDALTVDTPNVVDIPAINWKSEAEYTTALGGVVSDGVITNFPKSQYNNVIMARSYAKDADGNVVEYTETTERTLAQVASISLTDTREDYKITDAEDRTYLAGVCDYVLGEDGFELVQESVELVVGETLDLAGLFATTNGNEGLKAIWTVDGEDYVTVTKDEIGAVVSLKAKEAGEVLVTATIGTKTAELTVTTKAREIAANEVVDFKYATDVSRARVNYNGNTTATQYLDEYQGANGVLKVEEPEGWEGMDFRPLQDQNVYEEYKYLVMRIWVESLPTNGYFYIGKTTRSLTAIERGCWVDYYFDGASFLQQWFGTEAGQGLGSYYSGISTGGGTGVYYVDKIYMSKEIPVPEHIIYDADYSSTLTNFYTDENSQASYVENVGKIKYGSGGSNDIPMTGGIIKVDYEGTTSPWFSFKPAHSMATYKDYDYFIMHVWYVGGANQINSMQPGNGANCVYFGNGDGKTAWTDTSGYYFIYAFEISSFLNAWTDDGMAKVQLKAAGTGAGTYYISSIYAAKSIEKSTLNVTVNGAELTNETRVKAGDTISMYNPDNYGDIEMLVNGTAMTEFTAEAGKTYTITFKHINRVGNASWYHLRYDNGACYSNGGSTKTVTFTVTA